MATKKKVERKHAVKTSLRNVHLPKAMSALNLILKADGEKIGELIVGRGSFSWYGRSRKRRKSISWSEFATTMDEHAYWRVHC
jgi:hypothetical protein